MQVVLPYRTFPRPQIPENPVGTVVFFPGCARASRTFWPYQAGGCEECQGGQRVMSPSTRLLCALDVCCRGPGGTGIAGGHPACKCIPLWLAAGFPEEVAMTKMALARGYAVLTPTAKSRTGCWSSGGWAGLPPTCLASKQSTPARVEC